MNTETRALHFSVDGDFLTEFAREKCYNEGKLTYAVELLISGMQCDQLTDAQIEQRAYDILNGRARLTGTYPGPDYRLEYIPGKEKSTDIADAFVNMQKKLEDEKKKLEAMYRRYLFMCDHIPEWQLSRALKAYVNEGYVEDDPTFYEPIYADDVPGQDEYNAALFELTEELEENSNINYGRVLASTDPTSPAAISRVLADPAKAVDEFIERIHSDDRDDEYGWLEPNGTYHPVEWGKHAEWAANYLDEHYPFIPGPNGCYAELYYRNKPDGTKEYINNGDVLVYSLGWVLIDNPAQGMGRHTCRTDRPMTKAQKEFLFDYYTKRGASREANALYDNDDY